MARGTQHRKRRPSANAAVATSPVRRRRPRSRSSQDSWEDQLFFARLRRHAKWVFVFLALVFALSFVLFGVGSGSTGMGDSLSNFFGDIFQRSAGGSDVGSLEKKTEKNPKDAKAWADLATAQEQKENLDGAIVRSDRVHRAPAQGRRPAAGARRALSATGGRRTRSSTSPRRRSPPCSSRAPRSSRRRPRRSHRRSRIRSRPRSPRDDHGHDRRVPEVPDTQTKAVGVYKQIVGSEPQGRHEPVPPRAGRAVRQQQA